MCGLFERKFLTIICNTHLFLPLVVGGFLLLQKLPYSLKCCKYLRYNNVCTWFEIHSHFLQSFTPFFALLVDRMI